MDLALNNLQKLIYHKKKQQTDLLGIVLLIY